jgi:hypothetical protein
MPGVARVVPFDNFWHFAQTMAVVIPVPGLVFQADDADVIGWHAVSPHQGGRD